MKFNLLLSALVLASSSAFASGPNRLHNPLMNEGAMTPAIELGIQQPSASAPTMLSAGGDTYTFGYGGEPNNASFVAPDYKVFAVAMGLDPETTTQFAGAKVVKIQIANGRQSPNYPVEYFLTNDLEEFGELTEAVLTAGDDQWNEFELETPVELKAGEPLFVGYVGVNDTTLYKYPISFNYEADYEQNLYAFLYALPYGSMWQWTYYYGCVSIRVVLESDEFPHNQCTISLTAPDFIDTNDGAKATLTLTNTSVDKINKVGVEYSIGDQEGQTAEFECNLRNFNDNGTVEFDLHNVAEGINQKFNINVRSINGNPVEAYTGSSDLAYVSAFDKTKAYDRVVVAEEAFSTGDGFGPAAIEGMKVLVNDTPKGTAIGITTHEDDEMAVKGYTGSSYTGTARFNRLPAFANVYPDDGGYIEAYDIVSQIPTFATLELKVSATDKPKEFSFATETTFNLDANGSEFGLAFVVLEDKVGPYSQFNYYSNGIYGDLDWWRDQGYYVETLYNNVARGIHTYDGIANSLPEAIKGNEPVKYDCNATFESIDKPENCRFVAMLINQKTGVIENAVETTMDNSAISTVASSSEDITVKAEGGCIVAEGQGVAEVFTVDGCHIGSITAGSSLAVNSGIYVVSTPAGSVKILVK